MGPFRIIVNGILLKITPYKWPKINRLNRQLRWEKPKTKKNIEKLVALVAGANLLNISFWTIEFFTITLPLHRHFVLD